MWLLSNKLGGATIIWKKKMWLLSQKRKKSRFEDKLKKERLLFTQNDFVRCAIVPIKAEGQERQRANTNVWRLLLFRAAFIGCSLEASDKKGSFWNWSAWKWGVADNIWTPDIWESTKITRLHVELQERQQKAGDHPQPWSWRSAVGFWMLGSIKILNTRLNQDFEYSYSVQT